MDTIAIPFSRQQRITNTLLLNASFIENIGLMHGKMSIAIYFFHLARETGMQIYEDYAGELIDEIYEEVYTQSPCDFENGLAGIGWGIEYLVQNKFIDADTNEVLEEFDKQITHEIIFHTPQNTSILSGISGYILYFMSRLNSNEAGTEIYDSIYKTLMDLFDLFKQRASTQFISANAEVIWNEPDKFDLVWDYPCVIWVLTELIRIQVCAEDGKELITKLVSPVLNEGKRPKLQSHQLLTALALQKVKLVSPESLSGFNAEIFLTAIEREVIVEELTDKSAFLRNGTTGIAFIYRQLSELTNNSLFEAESDYWVALNPEFTFPLQERKEYTISNENGNLSFGILNGLAGINLCYNGKN